MIILIKERRAEQLEYDCPDSLAKEVQHSLRLKPSQGHLGASFPCCLLFSTPFCRHVWHAVQVLLSHSVASDSLRHHGLYSPGKNTGGGCHFLLQGIFLTQASNLGLLHCRQILYHWPIWESPSRLLQVSIVCFFSSLQTHQLMMFWLQIFNFTVIRKWYTFSSNHTLNF